MLNSHGFGFPKGLVRNNEKGKAVVFYLPPERILRTLCVLTAWHVIMFIEGSVWAQYVVMILLCVLPECGYGARNP